MLNEIMEVEAYLQEPQSDTPRIQPRLLTDDFAPGIKLNGLCDILALVASQYLSRFAVGMPLNDELIQKAILIMRIWCGFEGDVSKEEMKCAKEENKEWFQTYPDADGWLRKYYQKHMSHRALGWSAYSKEWGSDLKAELVYQAEKQCYENILAQAIAEGKPKEYYLLIKECENGIIPEVTKANHSIPDKRKRRNLWKLIAAYKMLERFHPGQEWVFLKTNRVLAWLGMESDKPDRWCTELLWRGEQLVFVEKHIDYKKLRVHPDFLRQMDIQLLDEKPEKIPEGYQVYYDTGHGKNNELKLLRI